MQTDTYTWRGIVFMVAHGNAPKNRDLYRVEIEDVSPPAAHLPFDTPRYGCHYVCKLDLGIYPDFKSYLFGRLERDATEGLIRRNARIVEESRQLRFDLT